MMAQTVCQLDHPHRSAGCIPLCSGIVNEDVVGTPDTGHLLFNLVGHKCQQQGDEL